MTFCIHLHRLNLKAVRALAQEAGILAYSAPLLTLWWPLVQGLDLMGAFSHLGNENLCTGFWTSSKARLRPNRMMAFEVLKTKASCTLGSLFHENSQRSDSRQPPWVVLSKQIWSKACDICYDEVSIEEFSSPTPRGWGYRWDALLESLWSEFQNLNMPST